MTLDKQITQGVEKLLTKAQQTSDNEPYLAIGQLLLSAAALAKMVGMTESDFVKGCDLARGEMYDD